MSAAYFTEVHVVLADGAEAGGLVAIVALLLIVAIGTVLAAMTVLWKVISQLMSVYWSGVKSLLLLTVCLACIMALAIAGLGHDGAVGMAGSGTSGAGSAQVRVL